MIDFDKRKNTDLNLSKESLKALLISQCTIDIVLVEHDYCRNHQLVSQDKDHALFRLDNGLGDFLHVLFAPSGAIISGLNHELALSPFDKEYLEPHTEIYSHAPAPLIDQLENLLHDEDFLGVSFCVWNTSGSNSWMDGSYSIENNDDGKWWGSLLEIQCAQDWCQNWGPTIFEQCFDNESIEKFFKHCPTDANSIAQLNPNRTIQDAFIELKMLGYPYFS